MVPKIKGLAYMMSLMSPSDISKVKSNNRLLSPLRGWDGLSAAARLQVRPKAGALGGAERRDCPRYHDKDEISTLHPWRNSCRRLAFRCLFLGSPRGVLFSRSL